MRRVSALDQARSTETADDGLYKLNDFQEKFVFSPAPILAGYGGIANGKTLAGVLRTLVLADQFPGNVILVGRLTYPELKDTTERQLLDVVKQRNGGTLESGPYVSRFIQNPDTLELRNGSTIMFRYLQNEQAILNLNLGACWVDQAEFVQESVILHLLGRLRLWTTERSQEFMKRFHRKPKHYAYFTGNPSPGWVEQRFKRGVDADGRPLLGWSMIEAPTQANLTNLPQGYLEQLKASYPESWVRRYLDGDWTTFEGQVYSEFQRVVHVIEPFTLPTHWPRYLGWDHGRTNPTAVSFIAVDEDGNLVVYNEYYKIDSALKEHAEAVRLLCQGDAVPRSEDGNGILVHMDPSVKGESDPEGRDFMQLYLDLGIIGLPANNQRAAGIGKVAMLMHPDPTHQFPSWHPRGEQRDLQGRVLKSAELGAPRFFIFSTCKSHLHELALYRYKEHKLGEMKNATEEPVKYMDHAMDAMRYAAMAAFERAKVPTDQTAHRHPALPSFAQHAISKLLALK